MINFHIIFSLLLLFLFLSYQYFLLSIIFSTYFQYFGEPFRCLYLMTENIPKIAENGKKKVHVGEKFNAE